MLSKPIWLVWVPLAAILLILNALPSSMALLISCYPLPVIILIVYPSIPP
jgi:hypothetical protein